MQNEFKVVKLTDTIYYETWENYFNNLLLNSQPLKIPHYLAEIMIVHPSNLELDENGNLKSKDENDFEEYLKKQPELFQFEIRKYLK